MGDHRSSSERRADEQIESIDAAVSALYENKEVLRRIAAALERIADAVDEARKADRS